MARDPGFPPRRAPPALRARRSTSSRRRHPVAPRQQLCASGAPTRGSSPPSLAPSPTERRPPSPTQPGIVIAARALATAPTAAEAAADCPRAPCLMLPLPRAPRGRPRARPTALRPAGRQRLAHHGAGQAGHRQGPAEKRWLQQAEQAAKAHRGGGGSGEAALLPSPSGPMDARQRPSPPRPRPRPPSLSLVFCHGTVDACLLQPMGGRGEGPTGAGPGPGCGCVAVGDCACSQVAASTHSVRPLVKISYLGG